jgi:acrylyl-CoA reductase (NADPH)
MFKAIQLVEDNEQLLARLVDLPETALAERGDIVIKVAYSSLNYKDALALVRGRPVVREFPMIPGIDLSGVIERSSHEVLVPGERVIVTGHGLGESVWGGYAQKAAVQADWVIPLPQSFSSRRAMQLGTAGFTAGLALRKLAHFGVTPEDGDILVTGATGGLGSLALMMLKQRGFRVVVSTGKVFEVEYLKRLGADEIIDRRTLDHPINFLQSERFAAVIDTLGSHTLANACAQTKAGGLVIACGMAQGMEFPGSVAPFILRGITLMGVNSVSVARHERVSTWAMLANDFDWALLDSITEEIRLMNVFDYAPALLAGQLKGRYIVNVN